MASCAYCRTDFHAKHPRGRFCSSRCRLSLEHQPRTALGGRNGGPDESDRSPSGAPAAGRLPAERQAAVARLLARLPSDAWEVRTLFTEGPEAVVRQALERRLGDPT
jgi:hypothetical protein